MPVDSGSGPARGLSSQLPAILGSPGVDTATRGHTATHGR